MDTTTKNTGQTSPLGPGFAGTAATAKADAPKRSVGSKALVTLGIAAGIIATAVLVTLSISYFPVLSSQISSVFVAVTSSISGSERLSVSAQPLSVSVGQQFDLSWKRSNAKGEGTYALFYPCQGSVHFERTADPAGSGLTVSETLPCGMYSTLKQANAEDSIRLIAASSDSRLVEMPLSLSYTPAATDTPSLSAEITVAVENTDAAAGTLSAGINILPETTTGGNNVPTPPASTTPAPVKKPATGTVAGTASSSYYQLPVERTAGTTTQRTYTFIPGTTTVSNLPLDLAVRVLETGYINKLTNTFVATSSVKASERVAVRFEVTNVGGKTSPTWYFNAVLPTFPSYTYTSDSQETLAPGDRIEFTIGFDVIYQGSDKTVVINIDPASSLHESNRTNNIAKVVLDGVIF